MDTVTLDFASLTNECKQNVGAILRGMPQESGSFSQHWFYGLSVEDQSTVISWVLVPTMGTTKKVGTIQASNDKDDAHEKVATAAKANPTTKRSGAKWWFWQSEV